MAQEMSAESCVVIFKNPENLERIRVATLAGMRKGILKHLR
jgi:hypothetical protein